MNEKLVKVKWDFIKLKCGCNHKSENGDPFFPNMVILEGIEGAYYDCPKEYCLNRIPLLAYEKVLDEVIRLINDNKIEIGYTWKMKCARQTYELSLLSYKKDEKAVISIKNITLRKK